jgi:hypothetical protein
MPSTGTYLERGIFGSASGFRNLNPEISIMRSEIERAARDLLVLGTRAAIEPRTIPMFMTSLERNPQS